MSISSGTAIAEAMTGKAAKALPVMIVNIAMPSAKTSTARKRLPGGRIAKVPSRIRPETPALSKTTPIATSNCGSTAAQPIASMSRRPSCSGAVTGGFSQNCATSKATSTPASRKK